MTQGELALASGVKQPDISKMERGKILRPAAILSIARALRCNPDWLDAGVGQWDALELGEKIPPKALQAPAIEPSGISPSAYDIALLIDQIPAHDRIWRARMLSAMYQTALGVLRERDAEPSLEQDRAGYPERRGEPDRKAPTDSTTHKPLKVGRG